MMKKLVCKTIAIISRHLSFAATSKAQYSDVNFVHYTTEEGLSQNTIKGVLQDNKGFIWVGTNDRLTKFDGYNFTAYRNKAKDTTTLRFNILTTLFVDSRGNLWIGKEDGGQMNKQGSPLTKT